MSSKFLTLLPPHCPFSAAAPTPMATLDADDQDAYLRVIAASLSVRQMRFFVGVWLGENYADATGDGTILCPLAGGDAVIPIPRQDTPSPVVVG